MAATKYSRGWHASSNARNQRMARRLAPLHMRIRLLRTSLSKELSERYETNTMPVRAGDRVKIMVGDHKGKMSKVHFVNHKLLKVYLDDVKVKKADGREVPIPFQASNLQIISLAMEDKRRLKAIERKKKKAVVNKTAEESNNEKRAEKEEAKKEVKKAEVKK
jgi:large subunit ribosomal protein L24